MTDYPIITVSRECGSGGHDIGMLLAEKLGIPAYDNEALAQKAVDSGIDPELFHHVDQQHKSAWSFALNSKPIDDDVFEAQYAVCRKLAEEGSAVMIGRCADYILRDYAPCINVFIQADEEVRIRRIMEADQLHYTDAKKRMQKIDKGRAAYHNYYADTKWGDRENYDLVISNKYGVEQTAELLYNALKHIIGE